MINIQTLIFLVIKNIQIWIMNHIRSLVSNL